jgi:hypothetical protein
MNCHLEMDFNKYVLFEIVENIKNISVTYVWIALYKRFLNLWHLHGYLWSQYVLLCNIMYGSYR